MRRGILCALGIGLLLVGCDEPPHPSQQAVERAEKLADEAARRAASAEQHSRHLERLREIDRARYESELAQSRSEAYVLRGLLGIQTLVLLIALVWLAREVRLRRVLATVLLASSQREGGEPRTESESSC